MTIKEVYEKYKHMDSELKFPLGCETFLIYILKDLWEAIREDAEKSTQESINGNGHQ